MLIGAHIYFWLTAESKTQMGSDFLLRCTLAGLTFALALECFFADNKVRHTENVWLLKR